MPVVAILFGAVTVTATYGGVAQLGERLLCKQDVVGSSPSTSIGQRPIESRQEKVEGRKIRDLEIFQGQKSFITAHLSPCLPGLLSTHYSLSLRVTIESNEEGSG